MIMNVFVVVYDGNREIMRGIRDDDGESTYAYAKEKGYSVRLWPMYGLTHYQELDEGTRDEIREFCYGLI